MISTSQKIIKTNMLDRLKMGVHDIRSPIMFLRVLQTSATSLSPREKSLLESATQRIIGVVDSMDKLLHSSSENDCEAYRAEAINLSSIIEEILLEKKYEYQALNIKFSYTPPVYADDYLIHGEIDDLERMLSNLLNNAVEACDENGIISLSLKLKNKMLYLSITDNGRGIPDEVLQKLRDGITVSCGKENGHGMGFHQIRNTVAKLGGDLTINSKLGVGSKIQIAFPIIVCLLSH